MAIFKAKPIKAILGKIWLFQWLRTLIQALFLDKAELKDYRLFKKKYKSILSRGSEFSSPSKRVLVVNLHGLIHGIKQEAMLAKGLQLNGYTPFFLIYRSSFWPVRYYRVFGFRHFVFFDDHLSKSSGNPLPQEIRVAINKLHTFSDVLKFEYNGVRIGKYALSTIARQLRLGTIDPQNLNVGPLLQTYLLHAIATVQAAINIIELIKPDLLLLLEKSYTPYGEIYSVALNKRIDLIQWSSCHREDALMLKRYTQETKDLNKSSLSDETWEMVKKMKFTSENEITLKNELLENYKSGQWFSEVGTQFHKKIVSKEEIQTRLGLDPTKKTAVVFAHLFWDEAFFEGGDLFGNFEKWFIETVRAACANPNLNWILKLHPANLVKAVRDNYKGDFSENISLKREIGELPNHIKKLEPNSEISTYSLFDAMDYCLTVRGTIGIEAASFGIPVFTAGKSRYDGLGFTIDSKTPHEYLERLKTIHLVPRLTQEQKEIAQKFAYALFVMRPLKLESMKVGYLHDQKATPKVEICLTSFDNLVKAQDLKNFAQWAMSAEKLDFLCQ